MADDDVHPAHTSALTHREFGCPRDRSDCTFRRASLQYCDDICCVSIHAQTHACYMRSRVRKRQNGQDVVLIVLLFFAKNKVISYSNYSKNLTNYQCMMNLSCVDQMGILGNRGDRWGLTTFRLGIDLVESPRLDHMTPVFGRTNQYQINRLDNSLCRSWQHMNNQA